MTRRTPTRPLEQIIAPGLYQLASDAAAHGWDRADVLSAILNWVISQALHRAGPEATREWLATIKLDHDPR